MGSTCSRDLQVCTAFISLPDSVTSYLAAKVGQSLCAEHIGRAQGRPRCPLVGRCWVPSSMHEQLEVQRRDMMCSGLATLKGGPPNSHALKPKHHLPCHNASSPDATLAKTLK